MTMINKFDETDTEDITSSLIELGSLNDELDTMNLDFDNSDEEVSDHEGDKMVSHTWDGIKPKSDAEFLEDHELTEDVISTSEDKAVNPIDCYRHFITDETIGLMVRETNRYAQYTINASTIKPTTNAEMLKFFGIILEMGLVKMPKLNYY
ncbi:unnamed protein product [Adineta ricciae]|uniref:PiggyBac transposable element-derived protein domain-containing protein n=1 Tax=Adineta ricciae TaxID=249248 RepID=A0A815TIQ9_ADIRI|nr:unnamed protein product [Adineta ricciae]CAF1528401.1 unnamed protein product [Adineta ricciae]